MADAEPQIHVANAAAAPAKPNLRRRLLTGIAGAVLIAGIGYGGWYVLVGSHYISTDNAYVGADTASVTPMVAALSAIIPFRRPCHAEVMAMVGDANCRSSSYAASVFMPPILTPRRVQSVSVRASPCSTNYPSRASYPMRRGQPRQEWLRRVETSWKSPHGICSGSGALSDCSTDT